MGKQKNNIIPGNKLIAESLGYKYFGFGDAKQEPLGWKKADKPYLRKLMDVGPVGETFYLCRKHEDLKFHRSWDWLIPACQKFAERRSKLRTIKAGVIHSLYAGNIRRAISRYDMPEAWKQLVEALEWLNSK